MLALVGCNSPKALVVTESNRQEIAEEIGKSSMSAEEKQLFIGAMAREAMGAMAKAFGMPAPSLNVKTVAQIIDEQKQYLTELEDAAKKEEARVSVEKAKAAEANRLIGSAVQVTVTDVQTVKGIMTYSTARFRLDNMGQKSIAALVGTVAFNDLVGKQLHSEEVRFNATVLPGQSLNVEERFLVRMELALFPSTR